MSLRLRVLGGTPRHGDPSLCFSCNFGYVIQGQQVSDLTVACTAYRRFVVKRPVVECTEYQRRNSQDKKEMEKIAWILETRKGRPVGFVSALEHKYHVKAGDLDDPEEECCTY